MMDDHIFCLTVTIVRGGQYFHQRRGYIIDMMRARLVVWFKPLLCNHIF